MQTYNDNAKYDRYISLFKKLGDNNYFFDRRVKFDNNNKLHLCQIFIAP